MKTYRREHLSFRRLALSLLSIELLVAPAFASSAGTTTGELLKIPVSARAIGMGEAYVGLANDSTALDWNPAGMTQLDRKEASFMHSSLLESVHYEYASFVAPTNNYALGTSFSYLGYGSIAGYDNSGKSIGNINASSYKFSGGIAHQLTDSFSLGIAASLLHETLDTYSAKTFAFNGGALYTLPLQAWNAKYTLGASILNLGQGLRYIDQRDPLPRQIKFGGAVSNIKNLPLTFTMDVSKPNDNSTYISLGSEYWFWDLVALRLGYAGANNVGRGLRAGVGLKYAGFGFDYAYGGFGDFGATQRLSVAWRFGPSVEQLTTEEKALLKEANASKRSHDYPKAILLYNRILDIRPGNETVKRSMVECHEAMLKQDLDDAVARVETGQSPVDANGVPVSDEDKAMNGLIAGNDMSASLAKPGKLANPTNPALDPLGLENLPDVNQLDVLENARAGMPGVGHLPETGPAGAVLHESLPPEKAGEAATVPASNGRRAASSATPAQPAADTALPNLMDEENQITRQTPSEDNGTAPAVGGVANPSAESNVPSTPQAVPGTPAEPTASDSGTPAKDTALDPSDINAQ